MYSLYLTVTFNETKLSVTKWVPKAANGVRVLLVDSDTVSLMYLATLLEQYSFKVTTTELASVALYMIQEEKDRFQLVIANMKLPDMDSHSFLKEVLKKDIPIIMMSSERHDNLAGKALAEGACYFLQKPVVLEDLKFMWQHVFRKSVINPMKESCKAKGEKMKNPGKESRGVKIIEIDDLSRASAKGNIIKETGGVCKRCHEAITIKEVDGLSRPPNEGNKFKEAGGVYGSAIVHSSDGIYSGYMIIDPKCKKKKHASLGNENHAKKLHDCHAEGSITKNKKKQGRSKTKRLRTEEEEQRQEKRTKINFKSKSSRSVKVNEEDGEWKDDSNSSTDRKRVIWTPELHLKFTAAISTLGDKKARPKSILKMMNTPNVSVRQVASHLQKYKSQVQRIYETGTTNIPSVSKSHGYRHRSEWKPLLQRKSALASRTGQKNFHFRGRTNAEFTVPKPLVWPTASVTSSISNNHRTSNLKSGQMGMNSNSNLYPGNNNPNEVHTENHAMLQKLNQVGKTSSFASNINMNENVKGRQMEGGGIQVPESKLANLSYVMPEAASPCISVDISQLLNAHPYVHLNQEFTPDLAASFVSHNQNQFTAGVPGITEVLEPEKAQITSGNENNSENFLTDFFDGIQDLVPVAEQAPPAAAAGSSNQNQSLLEYTDLLKFLEEDLDNGFDSAPNTGDLDHFCEWLEQTLEEKSTDKK
ncbi:hypothetical protein FNV43_RR26675 [Rhamnella rubrinervis]|uniref:Uncharacterized protein n=1 Tax=Rhamnella rubrinervis TaxID=2594499 RepID=A0A8K0DPJ7_9ROSA|nr:hypothetical protein FNV43_RR26675 [Rhamnella rubrinervis]